MKQNAYSRTNILRTTHDSDNARGGPIIGIIGIGQLVFFGKWVSVFVYFQMFKQVLVLVNIGYNRYR